MLSKPPFQIKIKLHYKLAIGFIILFLILAGTTAAVSICYFKNKIYAERQQELQEKIRHMESMLNEQHVHLESALRHFLHESGMAQGIKDFSQQSPFYYPSRFREHALNRFRKANLFHYQYEFLRSMQYFARKENLSRFDFYLLSPHRLFKDIPPQLFIRITRDTALLRQFESVGQIHSKTYIASLDRLQMIEKESFSTQSKKMKFMGFDPKKADAILRQTGFAPHDVSATAAPIVNPFKSTLISTKTLTDTGIILHVEFVLEDTIYNPVTDRTSPSPLGILSVDFKIDHTFLSQIKNKLGGEFAFFNKDRLVFSSIRPPAKNARLDSDGRVHIRNKQFLAVLSPDHFLSHQNNKIFAAALSDSDFIRSTIENTIRITIIIVLLLLIGIIFLTRTLVMWLVERPVGHLLDVVHHMISGDLSLRVPIRSNDEIGFLGYSFNHMVSTMQAVFSNLENAHQVIEQYNKNLEKIIEKRTRELNRKNLALNETIQKLSAAKETAETANRAKSEFLANVSHEIRTPLNAVLGFSQLLAKELSDPSQKDYVTHVISGSNTLLRLIDDILDLSVIDAGRLVLKRHPTIVSDIFNEMQIFFSLPVNKRGIRFITHIDPSLPPALMLDEVRVRQILFNLVGNAVKFTDNGYVKLSAVRQSGSRRKKTVNIVFCVQDTGMGIAHDQKQLIFEAFKQQEGQNAAKYGGTGLGLAFSKRLTEKMGGTIAVKSSPGRGSLFTVKLPNVEIAAKKSMPTTGRDNLLLALSCFKKATILNVDNLQSNRTLIRKMLTSKKLTILEANNGKEALDLAETYKPDAILMDMKMPVMNGYEATRIIKKNEKLRHIPVIAVSASVLESDEKKFREAGCDGILQKPIRLQNLLRELKRFLPYDATQVPETARAGKSSKLLPERLPEKLSGGSKTPVSHKNNLQKLKKVLQTEITPKLQRLQEIFLLDEIEQFSKEIVQLGITYQSEKLKNWGITLHEQSARLDMTRLPATLSRYHEITAQITRQDKDKKQP